MKIHVLVICILIWSWTLLYNPVIPTFNHFFRLRMSITRMFCLYSLLRFYTVSKTLTWREYYTPFNYLSRLKKGITGINVLILIVFLLYDLEYDLKHFCTIFIHCFMIPEHFYTILNTFIHLEYFYTILNTIFWTFFSNWNNCSLKKCILEHGCLKTLTDDYW